MEYRKLGRTDIEVSAVCMGCWSITGGRTWGAQDRGDSLAALRAALDAGITFFDTAPAYGDGESEQLLAKALDGLRQEVVIATKVSRRDLAARDVRRSCEASLRRLRTDYIDLLQPHWPSPDVPLSETFAALEKLRAQGKVRAIGVSNFGASYLREVLGRWRIESNQVAYSLLFRSPEFDVLGLCRGNDVGLLCYSPLCQALLTGKFACADDVPEGRARTRHFSKDRPQARHGEPGCEAETFRAIARIREIAGDRPMGRVALAWLLAQPGVASVIAGGRNAVQAADNASAGDLKLPPETVEALARATEPVKDRLGPNCDMWQSDSRADRPRKTRDNTP
jgi:aryl-alcohol dehydrogenase-like predicted oxidoreductase